MDTREVVARFEAERQALALMDHPSIAKVFDAGATDSSHKVAQASPPASSAGVSPGVSPGGETPPKLAGVDACATLPAGRPYFVMELVSTGAELDQRRFQFAIGARRHRHVHQHPRRDESLHKFPDGSAKILQTDFKLN